MNLSGEGGRETTETAVSCWTVNLEFTTFRILTLLENILYSDNLFIEPAGTLVFFTQESGTMAWRLKIHISFEEHTYAYLQDSLTLAPLGLKVYVEVVKPNPRRIYVCEPPSPAKVSRP